MQFSQRKFPQVPRSERLMSALEKVIRIFKPKVVVETGTYKGDGSTRIIAEAFGDEPPEAFYTIEISWALYHEAEQALRNLPFVKCIWGLSVDRLSAENFIRNDSFLRDHHLHPDLYIDSPEDPVSFYLKEIQGMSRDGKTSLYAPDRLLEHLLQRYRQKIPLIALDSAEELGGLSFRKYCDCKETWPFAYSWMISTT